MAAIVLLRSWTGMRSSDAARVLLTSVQRNLSDGSLSLRVGQQKQARGPARAQPRDPYVLPDTSAQHVLSPAAVIHAYAEHARALYRVKNVEVTVDTYLFTHVEDAKPLSTDRVANIVTSLLRIVPARIATPGAFKAHSLKHAAVSFLRRLGFDASQVSRFVRTTTGVIERHYDHTDVTDRIHQAIASSIASVTPAAGAVVPADAGTTLVACSH